MQRNTQYGYVILPKVSFKMGTFSDPQHTHPGIFILESPHREAYVFNFSVLKSGHGEIQILTVIGIKAFYVMVI